MQRFICQVQNCGLEFKNAKRLSEHKKRKHASEREILNESFLCEICGYCTRYSFNFWPHFRTHNGEKPYCCDKCGNQFATLSQLHEHYNSHLRHSETKADQLQKRLFKCPECLRIFSSSKALYHHKKLHLEYKSYECCYCDAEFAQAAGLSQHIRHQHNLKAIQGFPAKIAIETIE